MADTLHAMHPPHGNSRSRRCAVALSATVAALMLSAAPALADSVAYVKQGNVWLSTSDGARQYQVTFDGGYSTVSQADTGRLVALRGDRIRHLERDGRLIADIATPVTTTNDPSLSFTGPFDPEVSPDGKRVAYTYYWQYTGFDPYCNPSNNCYVKRLYHGTGFTDPNRLTAWDEPGFQRRSGWIDAAWVDSENVLLSDPYIQPNEDVVLWSPSDKDSLRRWFQDPLYPGDVAEAAISRDRSAMATVTDGDQAMSVLRSADRFYPEYPERCFEAKVDVADGFIHSPTFSANGTRLFWAERDGIHAATLPKFTFGSCGTLTDAGGLLLPGASSPAWGPAEVPPARPAQPAPPKPPVANPGTPATPLQPAAPAAARIVAARASLRTALRRGLTVRISGARPGRHLLTARVGRARVARATAAVGSDGAGRARLRFTARAKRQLGHRRSATLTVRGAGARLRITLRR